jgi:Fe-S oxidoreductase
MKIHYGIVERANESDNNDYWSETLCGLSETESPMSNHINEVSCKKCINKYKKYENHAKETNTTITSAFGYA